MVRFFIEYAAVVLAFALLYAVLSFVMDPQHMIERAGHLYQVARDAFGG